MKHALDVRGGILGLPLIRNVKTVDPADKSTPEVIQVETAMGAAVEVFEDSALIEVGRDRFVPVKTTNDLMVLRSDVYDIGPDFALDQAAAEIPFVDLDGDVYKLVTEFDKRFPDGTPSMKKASSFKVAGDWTFGHGVQVVGDVELAAKSAQRVADDTVLSGDASLMARDEDLRSVDEHRQAILDDLEPMAAGPAAAARGAGPRLRRGGRGAGLAAGLRQLRDGRLRRQVRRRPRGRAGDARDAARGRRDRGRPGPVAGPRPRCGGEDHDRRPGAGRRRRGGALRVDRPRRRLRADRAGARAAASTSGRPATTSPKGDLLVREGTSSARAGSACSPRSAGRRSSPAPGRGW